MSQDQQNWVGPRPIHAVRCPHCGQKHDCREFDYTLMGMNSITGADQDPVFVCETYDAHDNQHGCGKKFEVVKAQEVTMLWVRPVD